MSALGLVVAVALVFVLPGFTLTRALWPRGAPMPEHPVASTLFFTLAGSLGITVLVGAALGFLPGGVGALGWFQGEATGAPVLEGALVAVSGALFVVGAVRGAYPWPRHKHK